MREWLFLNFSMSWLIGVAKIGLALATCPEWSAAGGFWCYKKQLSSSSESRFESKLAASIVRTRNLREFVPSRRRRGVTGASEQFSLTHVLTLSP